MTIWACTHILQFCHAVSHGLQWVTHQHLVLLPVTFFIGPVTLLETAALVLLCGELFCCCSPGTSGLFFSCLIPRGTFQSSIRENCHYLLHLVRRVVCCVLRKSPQGSSLHLATIWKLDSNTASLKSHLQGHNGILTLESKSFGVGVNGASPSFQYLLSGVFSDRELTISGLLQTNLHETNRKFVVKMSQMCFPGISTQWFLFWPLGLQRFQVYNHHIIQPTINHVSLQPAQMCLSSSIVAGSIAFHSQS